jgi:long-subunit acyl-CoA synthetase (AMP-forming)
VEQALTDPAVHELYASELARINPMIDYKFQQVRRATVAQRMPSLDNGELTPSGKLVRKTIISNFKTQIDALFEADVPPEVIEIP